MGKQQATQKNYVPRQVLLFPSYINFTLLYKNSTWELIGHKAEKTNQPNKKIPKGKAGRMDQGLLIYNQHKTQEERGELPNQKKKENSQKKQEIIYQTYKSGKMQRPFLFTCGNCREGMKKIQSDYRDS